MSWTLSLIKQWLRDNDHSDNSGRAQRNYARIANDANKAMHGAGDFLFDRKKYRSFFEAAYTTGTVTIAAGATSIIGVGTVWIAGHTNRFMRLRGEDLQYLFTYLSGTTGTLETYRGPTNAAAAAYVLSQDRVTLQSSRFRKISRPKLAQQQYPLDVIDLDDLLDMRMRMREVSIPRVCAIEYVTPDAIGSAPVPNLWVYPSPDDAAVLDFHAYEWPMEMTADTHGISAPREAEDVHRAFCMAFLMLDQKDTAGYTTQLAVATAKAKHNLAAFRVREDLPARELWTPESDDTAGYNSRDCIPFGGIAGTDGT